VTDPEPDDAEARAQFFDTCLVILLFIALFTAVVAYLASVT